MSLLLSQVGAPAVQPPYRSCAILLGLVLAWQPDPIPVQARVYTPIPVTVVADQPYPGLVNQNTIRASWEEAQGPVQRLTRITAGGVDQPPRVRPTAAPATPQWEVAWDAQTGTKRATLFAQPSADQPPPAARQPGIQTTDWWPSQSAPQGAGWNVPASVAAQPPFVAPQPQIRAAWDESWGAQNRTGVAPLTLVYGDQPPFVAPQAHIRAQWDVSWDAQGAPHAWIESVDNPPPQKFRDFLYESSTWDAQHGPISTAWDQVAAPPTVDQPAPFPTVQAPWVTAQWVQDWPAQTVAPQPQGGDWVAPTPPPSEPPPALTEGGGGRILKRTDIPREHKSALQQRIERDDEEILTIITTFLFHEETLP